MGTYLNPGKQAFEESVNSEIFVDKTEMIRYLNSVARTEQKLIADPFLKNVIYAKKRT